VDWAKPSLIVKKEKVECRLWRCKTIAEKLQARKSGMGKQITVKASEKKKSINLRDLTHAA